VARQAGAFPPHPFLQLANERSDALPARRHALGRRAAVDFALDGEDRIDAADRLARQRRLAQIGQFEEVAPSMAPARGLGNRARFALSVVEIAEPGISVGLEDRGIAGKMPGGVLAVPVARVEEHRRRRIGPGERPVVAHIGP